MRSIANIANKHPATVTKSNTNANPPPPGWIPPPCSPEESTMTPPRSSPHEESRSITLDIATIFKTIDDLNIRIEFLIYASTNSLLLSSSFLSSSSLASWAFANRKSLSLQ